MAFLITTVCITLLVVGLALYEFGGMRVERVGLLVLATSITLFVCTAVVVLWIATAVEMGWISAAQIDAFF